MSSSAKRVTSLDVARAAGVSRTTVSFVLNDRPGQTIPEATRVRVLEAADRLQYRPHASARALAAGRSDIVLLSIPDLPIGAGISRFVEELAAALADRGLTLVTHLAGAHGNPVADVCATVGASVVVGFDPFDDDTVEALRLAGAAVVLPSVGEEPAAGRPIGLMQARHLVAQGHRRLGFALPALSGLRAMATDRLHGVEDACAEAGIAPPVVLETPMEVAGAAEAVSIWTSKSVTGICAFNDDVAIAVLAGIRERGLNAPQDLAVIGADDIPTARLAQPPLTTIRFDLHEVARQRAAAVVDVLSGQKAKLASGAAAPRIVERSST
ncbi:LacI family transcriptional regulator [Amycolatopsis sp. NBRC 101858]|uniref:LacI family DNA-binding transcriptional regulator n=1 Tax=Amycolatopsis sp. NBRC 101858 TaxID=3032200 RepID=UPI0024A34389|nr:LacI family DNA-binding transcriptional regulator [Amycolatopsis sp. NBRC 101858]GLY38869.1 LacI family transcriptional regulator [Amycolatopsis sp. NBRC 101858]